ncbi:MAG: universal stress protein, partial [Solirubrobacteraceae bacterium]
GSSVETSLISFSIFLDPQGVGPMAPHAIISYDDTQDDHDALAMGRVLAEAGATLTLAYVRHIHQPHPDREQLAEHEAEGLLDRGAAWLEQPDVGRRVVMSASTGQGLGWLAEQEQADIIVFGSDYRTRTGHISVGRSAQTLLESGPAALAIAPAGFHAQGKDAIETIGVLPGSADEAAIETAFSLAKQSSATVVDREHGVDLLVVGSRSEAPHGRVMISARSLGAIEEATSPVLIVARGVALHFEPSLITA